MENVSTRIGAAEGSEVSAAGRFLPLDYLVLAYTTFVLVFAWIFHDTMPSPQSIIALHVFVLCAMILVPPRGAPWESWPAASWRFHVREFVRFFRYSYPLLLVLFYFEEGRQTVGAMWGHAPYWFEPYLYAADERIFGVLPSVAMNAGGWVNAFTSEVMHFFYFSYYLILIGGVVVAWVGRRGEAKPARGFQTTLGSVIAAFFLCFVWYPFLPARGPWENPELMAGMIPFEGFVFVPVIEKIIQHGAVSGGCFPSSHVAGAWGVVFGLWPFHRRKALFFGFFALGMSLACVFTRYHHGVDVPAGFTAGLVGAGLSYWWNASKAPAE